MLFWQKSPKTVFVIESNEWKSEDDSDMRDLVGLPQFSLITRLLQKRLNKLTEDLVNGADTRARIDEIKDLLLELKNYEPIPL